MNLPPQRSKMTARAALMAATLAAFTLLAPSGVSSVPIFIPDEEAFVAVAQPGQVLEWERYEGPVYQADGFTIRADHGGWLRVRDWEPTHEGLDLALDSHESLIFEFEDPRTSFGLDVFDGSAVDSNWDITFYLEGEVVFETFFEGVPDQWSFFGVMLWGCEFDRVRFVEDNGSPENDYFGNFFAGGADEGILALLPL